MANVLGTSFTHTWAGKEFLSELFFVPQTMEDNPWAGMRTMTDVNADTHIYLPGSLSGIVREDTGCGFSAVGSVNITDRKIAPCRLKINVEECEDAFWSTVFQTLQKSGINRADLRGTLMYKTIRQVVMNTMMHDVPNLGWWGAESSGHAFYGICDGFWELFFDNSANVGYSLDMSSDTDYETSSTSDIMATDGTLNALRNLWENQKPVMRKFPLAARKILMTSSCYDNLLNTFENTGTDSGLTRLRDGQALKFRGVEVVDKYMWDESLDDSNNPSATTIGDNCILYVIPDNLIVGTDVNDPKAQVKVWFDEKDEKVYQKIKWMQAQQYVHADLINIAY